jgi:hypothetical protein
MKYFAALARVFAGSGRVMSAMKARLGAHSKAQPSQQRIPWSKQCPSRRVARRNLLDRFSLEGANKIADLRGMRPCKRRYRALTRSRCVVGKKLARR